MSDHMPGPWTIDDKRMKVTGPKGLAVCEPYTLADARLIAAAPDLLSLAKQYASECMECAGVGITVENEGCDECRFIRDVIAKAQA